MHLVILKGQFRENLFLVYLTKLLNEKDVFIESVECNLPKMK